ncbi:MAG: ribonuclease HII [Lentisphaerae bacterium GWF2_52_8]|nr:MAG: ribonuclease HII [Lentisphaerae bacterium GWF2_52_8]
MTAFLADSDPLLSCERKLWGRGVSFLAGVDEAGRGPLAGPLVVAAVIFPPYSRIPQVNDSKQLSPGQRTELRAEILAVPGLRHSLVSLSAQEIDKLNILRATHQGMRRALEELKGLEYALVDGLPVPGLPVPSDAIVKGDSLCASIAAASILAKVCRDELMLELARSYPEYGFERHKGYGTAAHLEALRKHGPCPEHRRSFAPVRAALEPAIRQLGLGL